ncbi:hypothetical protein [Marinobacter nauticus]|nr:hypothetical protein [Marinobacter nauticus]MBY5936967.1 hypothetical protein [Marinobacter nauticus]MBY5954195.1 hypothetical protein [Marinobacter nauticus]MBY6007988.1 hypothetical protein [Marinobacter nauticus]
MALRIWSRSERRPARRSALADASWPMRLKSAVPSIIAVAMRVAVL